MTHLFKPEKLHAITTQVIGLEHEAMVASLEWRLAHAYPGHIEPGSRWLFNFPMGATFAIKVLYASFSEFLVIFGTSIGTGGYSGRYTFDIYDFVLEGEQHSFRVEAPGNQQVHVAGDVAQLPRGVAQGYKLPGAYWALEYGRGSLIRSLPAVLAATIFDAGDFRLAAQTLKVYARALSHSLFAKGKV